MYRESYVWIFLKRTKEWRLLPNLINRSGTFLLTLLSVSLARLFHYIVLIWCPAEEIIGRKFENKTCKYHWLNQEIISQIHKHPTYNYTNKIMYNTSEAMQTTIYFKNLSDFIIFQNQLRKTDNLGLKSHISHSVTLFPKSRHKCTHKQRPSDKGN